MPGKRYSSEEIADVLRRIEAMKAEGHSVTAALRMEGIAEATYYRWKAEAEAEPGSLAASYRLPAKDRQSLPEPDHASTMRLAQGAALEQAFAKAQLAEPTPLWRRLAGAAAIVVVSVGLSLLAADMFVPRGPVEAADPATAQRLADTEALIATLQSEREHDRARLAEIETRQPDPPTGATQKHDDDLAPQIEILWKGAAEDRAELARLRDEVARLQKTLQEKMATARRD